MFEFCGTVRGAHGSCPNKLLQQQTTTANQKATKWARLHKNQPLYCIACLVPLYSLSMARTLSTTFHAGCPWALNRRYLFFCNPRQAKPQFCPWLLESPRAGHNDPCQTYGSEWAPRYSIESVRSYRWQLHLFPSPRWLAQAQTLSEETSSVRSIAQLNTTKLGIAILYKVYLIC